MAEMDPVEGKALMYLLGELPANETLEFERRIETSPVLIAHLRELEEGSVTLALACPPKRAPKVVWTNIEKAIEKERRVIVPWEWLRDKGWVAAAACLVGWVIYAVLTHRPHSTDQGLASTRLATEMGQAATNAVSAIGGTGTDRLITTGSHDEPPRTNALVETTPIELATLRTQVAQLRGQLAQISQAVTQQQALLSDPARLKFIGLAPLENGAANATNGLSPQLQHAIGLAMARELGWLVSSNSSVSAIGEAAVDFVDLRNQSTNPGTPGPLKAPELALPAGNNPVTGQDSSAATPGLLPAFASNDHVTVALDNTLGPPGSQVTLATMGTRTNGASQILGGATLGNNPLVVTFNSAGAGDSASLFQMPGDGLSLIVTSVTPGGTTNLFQFIATPAP